jgi:hypothetical protein
MIRFSTLLYYWYSYCIIISKADRGNPAGKKNSGGFEDMRVIALLFAMLLVTGLSFGGNSFFGSTPTLAQDDPAGEAPGGDMPDEATDGSGAATDAADKATMGETPGGDMTDEATDGSGAATDAADKATEGELPGDEKPDEATQ